ncbi:HpcH/HpaI aldolase/citrate lyase family protein [Pacificibacter marinus]|uniref:(3S)-malyl-CoA thioesterase n=1 Tax=Pacificibacter marinus TaxID=658057 RepID=A0A1Y5SDP1_9RHOB|nr:CoA ester lyase [Pacificibacter marinus]SEK49072.1 (3S)-malyl-CoA thioesterase [Pacificibacter marinus]SLN36814.1 (3S)-malyl-CoA thioesterase [Pacificibacter marinus]
MTQASPQSTAARPYRSALYIPGAKERALEKAKGLACDVILFDLEDAVVPDEKIAARATLKAAIAAGGYGARAKIVRVNGFDTAWGADDVAAFVGTGIDGILLPKVESAAMVDALAEAIPDVPLWAMMETPLGLLNAAEIAAHPRMAGFVLGTNDLAKELNARFRQDRLPMMGGLHLALLAARAYGLVALDGVYNAFKDDAGLQFECEQGRDMGFDGKTLIHPAQLAIANAAFAPSADEIDLATRQIAAFEASEAKGEGVAVVDGKIVENLHIVTARATLEKARAIKAME